MKIRILKTVLLAAAALGIAAPAFADPYDWHRDREWREHHRRPYAYYNGGYYGGYYYAPPPPVVYAPPPPPPVYAAPSLNFVIPLGGHH